LPNLSLVGLGLLGSPLRLFCQEARFFGLCRSLLALLLCCGALLRLSLGLLLRLLSLLSRLFRLLMSLLLSLLGLLSSLLTRLFRYGALPGFGFSLLLCILGFLSRLLCLGLCLLCPSFRLPALPLDSGLLFGFEAHHASLFGRLHRVARNCADWSITLFPAVIVLCLIQKSLGALEDFWCVLIGVGVTRDANGIPCLDKIQRSFFVSAVNTLFHRFDLRNVSRPWQNLVPDINSLGTAFRIGPNRVLGDDQLARCAGCKIGFCRDYQSEGL
jgi:hypothetical protein